MDPEEECHKLKIWLTSIDEFYGIPEEDQPELIEEMGVKQVQVEELYSIEDEALQALGPVYGLIFLFKWRCGEKDDRQVEEDCGDVYFASQVINNACATQAILSILMNSQDIDIGPELSNLKSFTMEFPPDLKGLAISNCESIRKAHNSFSRPEAFASEEKPAGKEDDVFHFISYVPVNGVLYELDGLKKGPINLGSCSPDTWMQVARPIIQKRIQTYSSSEIRFNLLAFIKSPVAECSQQLAVQKARVETIQLKMSHLADPSVPLPPTMDSDLPSDGAILQNMLAMAELDISQLTAKLTTEKVKRKKWKDENIRRKHNYIPFIFNMLKVLAEKKQLKPLIEKARTLQQGS